MTPALEELKVRARVRVNAARKAGEGGGLSLRDCLHEASRAVGFLEWEHARRVLGGLAERGDDMGTFWHAPGCQSLINEWHADERQAREALAPGKFLLPYRRQFMVVQEDFIRVLGLDPQDPAWGAASHDLVAHYGSAAWVVLCAGRVRAPAQTFGAR
jgi:hypothetical protein